MKMYRTFFILITALVTCFLINGCAMFGKKDETNPFPKPKKVEDYTGPEELSPIIANQILDRTMKGIKEGSYKDFSYRFNTDLKSRITADELKKLREGLSNTIGEYESREYLGELRKGPWKIYLWKARFSKAKNNDLVIKLTLGELDKAVQVFAFDISPR